MTRDAAPPASARRPSRRPHDRPRRDAPDAPSASVATATEAAHLPPEHHRRDQRPHQVELLLDRAGSRCGRGATAADELPVAGRGDHAAPVGDVDRPWRAASQLGTRRRLGQASERPRSRTATRPGRHEQRATAAAPVAPENAPRPMPPGVRLSRASSDVIRNPERAKNRSTPRNPPPARGRGGTPGPRTPPALAARRARLVDRRGGTEGPGGAESSAGWPSAPARSAPSARLPGDRRRGRPSSVATTQSVAHRRRRAGDAGRALGRASAAQRRRDGALDRVDAAPPDLGDLVVGERAVGGLRAAGGRPGCAGPAAMPGPR